MLKGTIYRKHVWESVSKAASNRAWTKHYFVIKNGQLVAYKDQKQAKQDKQVEAPIDLAGAYAEEAKDYKKPHCFSLRLPNGGEFMFRAKDDNEMNLWIDSLRTVTGDQPESSGLSQSSRAQTLPASASAPEKKKGGFLTLKRK